MVKLNDDGGSAINTSQAAGLSSLHGPPGETDRPVMMNFDR